MARIEKPAEKTAAFDLFIDGVAGKIGEFKVFNCIYFCDIINLCILRSCVGLC